MNTKNIFNTEVGTDIAEEIIDIIPARQAWPAVRAKGFGPMVESALLEAKQDALAALLTQSAMENVGALAAMSNKLSSLTPQAEPIYNALVAAYAKKAIQRIERW